MQRKSQKTARHAMQAHEKCNARKDRIDCLRCVFRVRVFQFLYLSDESVDQPSDAV